MGRLIIVRCRNCRRPMGLTRVGGRITIKSFALVNTPGSGCQLACAKCVDIGRSWDGPDEGHDWRPIPADTVRHQKCNNCGLERFSSFTRPAEGVGPCLSGASYVARSY